MAGLEKSCQGKFRMAGFSPLSLSPEGAKDNI
jgi:hypothetical protein